MAVIWAISARLAMNADPMSAASRLVLTCNPRSKRLRQRLGGSGSEAVTAITSVVRASLEAATLEAHQEPGADGGHESHAHQE
jgi:hypothetical protein